MKILIIVIGLWVLWALIDLFCFCGADAREILRNRARLEGLIDSAPPDA